MQLTKPRRRVIYGGNWILIGFAAICFACLFVLPGNPESITIDNVYGDDIHVGIISWLKFGESDALGMPGPVFRLLPLGLVANVLIATFILWICVKGWKRSVDRFTVNAMYCDECGYMRRCDAGHRCSECGSTPSGDSNRPASWLGAVVMGLVGGAALCISMLGPSMLGVFAFSSSLDVIYWVAMALMVPSTTMILIAMVIGLWRAVLARRTRDLVSTQ